MIADRKHSQTNATADVHRFQLLLKCQMHMHSNGKKCLERRGQVIWRGTLAAEKLISSLYLLEVVAVHWSYIVKLILVSDSTGGKFKLLTIF